MWVFAILAGLAGTKFYASSAIMRHAGHGRIIGIVLGLLMLCWMPIGTIIGACALWYLIKGWGDDEPATAAAAHQ
jgi:hypothetical protein